MKLKKVSFSSRRGFLAAAGMAGAGLSFDFLRQPAAAARPAPLTWPHPGKQIREYVIRDATIVTMDPGLGDLAQGDILIGNGKIKSVGQNLPANGLAEIDARGMIAMPGFIDTHWHLWNSSLRGLIRTYDPKFGYFPLTLRMGPLFTAEDSYRSVKLGLMEAVASGITTVHNWSHNIRSSQHAAAELRALRESHIRGRFSIGWGQDLPLKQPMDLRYVGRIKDRLIAEQSLLSLGVAIRTPAPNARGAVPLNVLKADWEETRRLGLPITLHCRPGVVSLLEAEGLLGNDIQLVHAQGLTTEEIAILAKRGVHFSSSPIIDMYYAWKTRGPIQLAELERAGVQFSLSIDNLASSGNADFFGVMKAQAISHAQRFSNEEHPMPLRRMLQLATIDGARDLGIADQTGSLTPGKRADLILIRSTDANLAPIGQDLDFMLVFGAQPRNVDTVIVDGHILMSRGHFTAIDPERIVREVTESVTALRKRDV